MLDVEPVGSLTSVEFRFDEYVRGSGSALPFADKSFDIVTAHDTLEHIPAEMRGLVLEEISRVARDYVIIGGPLYSPDVVRAESRLDAFVRTTLQWEQPFLAEHIELGLPRPELIEGFLAERGMAFISVPSGNLERWLILQALRHYLAAVPETESLREDVDRLYNRLFWESDSDGVCYRRVYVASLDAAGKRALEAVSRRYPAAGAEQPARLGEIEGLLKGFEGSAASIREHLSSLHKRIFQAEQAAFEARTGRDEAMAALLVREEESQRQQDAIRELDRKLSAARAELHRAFHYRMLLYARRGIGRMKEWLGR